MADGAEQSKLEIHSSMVILHDRSEKLKVQIKDIDQQMGTVEKVRV